MCVEFGPYVNLRVYINEYCFEQNVIYEVSVNLKEVREKYFTRYECTKYYTPQMKVPHRNHVDSVP